MRCRVRSTRKKQKDVFFDLIDRGGTVRAAAEGFRRPRGRAYTWLRQAGLSMQRAPHRVHGGGEGGVLSSSDRAARTSLLLPESSGSLESLAISGRTGPGSSPVRPAGQPSPRGVSSTQSCGADPF